MRKKSNLHGTPGIEAAREAKARVRSLLTAGGETAAVGVARRPDGYAVRVTLSRSPRADVLPAEVAGVPVEVRISPEVVALGG